MDVGDIFSGFSLCRTNARNLFSGADAVSADNPGLANSLAILSAEECVKCFVLFAICSDVQVPFLIKPIFSKHWDKHVTGKELHNFVRIMSHFFGLSSSKRSDKVRSLLGLTGELFGMTKSDELTWWDSVNEMKNNGLYVDYRQGKFCTPATISAETFTESKGL